MTEIHLHPLRKQDCEKVAQIAEQCLPEHWSLSGILDTLRYDNNFFYVAWENENLIGYAGCMVIAEEAELLTIAVLPDNRQKGVGASLLQRLLEVAKEQNAKRMLLEVREGNTTARRMYEKFGFAKLGTRIRYYSNPVENAVIMERDL